jgi:hypothetical protein
VGKTQEPGRNRAAGIPLGIARASHRFRDSRNADRRGVLMGKSASLYPLLAIRENDRRFPSNRLGVDEDEAMRQL